MEEVAGGQVGVTGPQLMRKRHIEGLFVQE